MYGDYSLSVVFKRPFMQMVIYQMPKFLGFLSLFLLSFVSLGETTPFGSPRGGSDGGVSQWQDVSGECKSVHHRLESDKKLYSITRGNMSDYDSLLPEGQRKLFEQYPEYSMDIYPSFRNHHNPDWFNGRTARDSSDRRINLNDSSTVGIPNVTPTDARQVMENVLRRHFVGVSSLRQEDHIILNGIEANRRSSTIRYYPINDRERLSRKRAFYLEQVVASGGQIKSEIKEATRNGVSPTSKRSHYDSDTSFLSGSGISFHGSQRNGFSGSIDDYHWRIKEKQKEMLVPANSLSLLKADLNSLVTNKFIKPEVRRYELRRVWVVVGEIPSGIRSGVPKRQYYVDEDSWEVLAVDVFDSRGEIVQFQETFPMTSFGNSMSKKAGDVIYDLSNGSAYVTRLKGIATEITFSPKIFTQKNLDKNYLSCGPNDGCGGDPTPAPTDPTVCPEELRSSPASGVVSFVNTPFRALAENTLRSLPVYIRNQVVSDLAIAVDQNMTQSNQNTSENESLSSDGSGRLVNEDAEEKVVTLLDVSNNFVSVVALMVDDQFRCSGVLVSPKKLLTAAHCVFDKKVNKAVVGNSIYRLTAESSKDFRTVLDVLSEPIYIAHMSGEPKMRDLALLELLIPYPMRAKDYPKWGALPGLSNEKDGIPSVVAGFGATDYSLGRGGRKNHVEIEVVDCQHEQLKEQNCLLGAELVGKNQRGNNKDSCLGDSGGGLFWFNGKDEFHLVGVVSRKINGGLEPHCGSGGIYSSILNERTVAWLNKEVM